MKKPYLDFYQRESIKHDTLQGAMLKVNIEMKKVARELDRFFSFVIHQN